MKEIRKVILDDKDGYYVFMDGDELIFFYSPTPESEPTLGYQIKLEEFNEIFLVSFTLESFIEAIEKCSEEIFERLVDSMTLMSVMDDLFKKVQISVHELFGVLADLPSINTPKHVGYCLGKDDVNDTTVFQYLSPNGEHVYAFKEGFLNDFFTTETGTQITIEYLKAIPKDAILQKLYQYYTQGRVDEEDSDEIRKTLIAKSRVEKSQKILALK